MALLSTPPKNALFKLEYIFIAYLIKCGNKMENNLLIISQSSQIPQYRNNFTYIVQDSTAILILAKYLYISLYTSNQKLILL